MEKLPLFACGEFAVSANDIASAVEKAKLRRFSRRAESLPPWKARARSKGRRGRLAAPRDGNGNAGGVFWKAGFSGPPGVWNGASRVRGAGSD
jgi:hypothetical protein